MKGKLRLLGGNCHRPAGQQQKTDDDDVENQKYTKIS